MDQIDYFSIFKAALDLKGKDVLEVGGAVPSQLIETSGVRSWTAVDISSTRLEDSASNTSSCYRVVHGDIADFPGNGEYDVAYSTNCFEHILRLDEALESIYRALRPGGILFSVFAPIWSSPVGHHAYVEDGDRVITFNHGIVPPWFHLAYEENEVRDYVAERYSSTVADDFCRMTFHGNDLNRFVDRDYEEKIGRYPYHPIVKVRIPTRLKPDPAIKSAIAKRYPRVRNFATMGYFWVLKKGRPGPMELLRFYTGGLWETGRRKLR